MLLDKLSWVYLAGLSWPFAIVLIDEFVKKFERDWWTHHQRVLRLQFGTKLGKYSPREEEPLNWKGLADNPQSPPDSNH
jgi:hypothetical protein